MHGASAPGPASRVFMRQKKIVAAAAWSHDPQAKNKTNAGCVAMAILHRPNTQGDLNGSSQSRTRIFTAEFSNPV